MTYRQARGTRTARHGGGTADWLGPARRGMGCDNSPLLIRPPFRSGGQRNRGHRSDFLSSYLAEPVLRI